MTAVAGATGHPKRATAAYLTLGLADGSNRRVMGEDVERECAQR